MSTVAFTYDTFVTMTISKSPYEIVDSFRLKQHTNHILIADYYRVSQSASSIASSVASHVHELHEKINDKVAQNNANYMLRADVKNKLKTFNVCDVNKLHACSADSFQILNKLDENIYIVDFGISSIFNIKVLVDYKALHFILLI